MALTPSGGRPIIPILSLEGFSGFGYSGEDGPQARLRLAGLAFPTDPNYLPFGSVWLRHQRTPTGSASHGSFAASQLRPSGSSLGLFGSASPPRGESCPDSPYSLKLVGYASSPQTLTVAMLPF